MTDLYLVAHKCRGEAQWDIAIQLNVSTPTDPGPWWISNLGGWRIYPYRVLRLQELSGSVGEYFFEGVLQEMPPDSRDCFGASFDRAPKPILRPKSSPQDLASFLS